MVGGRPKLGRDAVQVGDDIRVQPGLAAEHGRRSSGQADSQGASLEEPTPQALTAGSDLEPASHLMELRMIWGIWIRHEEVKPIVGPLVMARPLAPGGWYTH